MPVQGVLRKELPELPQRMKRLPVERGFPVPWFCVWIEGELPYPTEVEIGQGRPEFRMMSGKRLDEAVKLGRCWVCGEKLGRYRAYTIGCMCLVNRINAEPPSHTDCSDFSARACPFLSRPHMSRRENKMPEGGEMAGVGIMRNPGVACVYVTESPLRPFADPNGKTLFALPDPVEVRFYAEGRVATPEEVSDSIGSGLPKLLEVCQTAEERAEVMDRGLAVFQTFFASESGELWAKASREALDLLPAFSGE